jgi:hypothetical protein
MWGDSRSDFSSPAETTSPIPALLPCPAPCRARCLTTVPGGHAVWLADRPASGRGRTRSSVGDSCYGDVEVCAPPLPARLGQIALPHPPEGLSSRCPSSPSKSSREKPYLVSIPKSARLQSAAMMISSPVHQPAEQQPHEEHPGHRDQGNLEGRGDQRRARGTAS